MSETLVQTTVCRACGGTRFTSDLERTTSQGEAGPSVDIRERLICLDCLSEVETDEPQNLDNLLFTIDGLPN
jgi:hypothetical protein